MSSISTSGSNTTQNVVKKEEPRCSLCLAFLKNGADHCTGCGTPIDTSTGRIISESSELQEQRFQSLRRKITFCKLGFAGLAVLAIIIFMIDIKVLLILPIGAAVYIYLLMIGTRDLVKNFAASTVGRKTLEQSFIDVVFDTGNGFKKEIIAEAELVNHWRYSDGSSHTSCSYVGQKLEFASMCLWAETNRNGRDGIAYLFDGRWFILDYATGLNDKLLVHERTRADKDLLPGHSEFTTDNEEFNKRFRVTCTGSDMFYKVISPKMIWMILELEKACGGLLLLSFTGGKLHIAVSAVDPFFKADDKKAVDMDTITQRAMNDVQYIMNIIKIMNT